MQVFYIIMIVILSLILIHVILKTLWLHFNIKSIQSLVQVYVNLNLLSIYKSISDGLTKDNIIEVFLTMDSEELFSDELIDKINNKFKDYLNNNCDDNINYEKVYCSVFKPGFDLRELKSFELVMRLNDIRDILDNNRYHQIQTFCKEKMSEFN